MPTCAYSLSRAGITLDVENVPGHLLMIRESRETEWHQTMLAEVDFLYFPRNTCAYSCLFTSRVRASHLTLRTFEATFNDQRKPSNRMASTMLAEVNFLDLPRTNDVTCAYSFCASGRHT